MRGWAGVPHLTEHDTALGETGRRYPPPAFYLFAGVEAWCAEPPARAHRYRGRLTDDQAALRCALRVVLDHQVIGHIVRQVSAGTGERRHDNTMREIYRAN